MAASSDKIENCEVCAANTAKYTCPKCEVRTCGLSCVNIHKKELDCDGIRDKTKFIPMNSFTDLDLLSDYRLLEGIGRSVEQLQTDPLRKCTRQAHLPLHLQRLRTAAFNRGINLEFMPQNFSRHKENSTYLNWKHNELYWRVEVVFSQADNIKWVLDRVLDTKKLSTLLEEIIYPNQTKSEPTDNDSSKKLEILQSKLKYYQSCGLPGLKILLKAEKVEKSDSRFYELDMALSLQDNLKNKTIIDFPIIYVALKDHSDMFEVIETDDEDVVQSMVVNKRHKNRRHKIDNRNKRIIKTEDCVKVKKEDSSVNYFFNGDVSDSEDESNTEMKKRRNFNKNQELSIPDYHQLLKME